MNILIALLVAVVIGLLAGVMLALASHFFKVEENETVKAVRECLPGANCGACGFAGCDAYADAVANGKAEALEFNITDKSRITNIPLQELNIRENTLIGSIYRNGQVIFPSGQDMIMVGDTVMVVLSGYRLSDIEDILEDSK